MANYGNKNARPDAVKFLPCLGKDGLQKLENSGEMTPMKIEASFCV